MAIYDSLGEQPLSEYDPVAESKKRFPELKEINGHIVDIWDNPITITIKRLDDDDEVTIICEGKAWISFGVNRKATTTAE
jgi:hypothetical protein